MNVTKLIMVTPDKKVRKISYTRGLRRGWLTPACGFAHARNCRGCRQIEAANVTVLPRRGCAIIMNNIPWLRQVEQRKTKQTLHPAHNFKYYQGNRLEAHNE